MQEAGIDLAGPMDIQLAGTPIQKVLKRWQVLNQGINISKMHRTSVSLYELEIWDLTKNADVAGKYMIDIKALASLPNRCTKVPVRRRCSWKRFTLLVNGHNWKGQAPVHAFQSTIAPPKTCREVKRGLFLADKGTHSRPAFVERRKIDSLRCRRARTQPRQPEVEHEGRLPGPPHVPMNDGVPANRQTQVADAGTHSANR